uniref:Uncharacterized protein n=1 Tax=Anopheles dirus TaxID=7168 RepID=A0A182N983_9DIPT
MGEGASNVYNHGPSAPAGRPGNGGGDDDVLGTLGLNPNKPFGQPATPAPARPAASGPGLYPSLPTDNNPGNRYGGNGGSGGYSGGGGSYNGGGAGGGSSYGGGAGGGGHFDGAGGNIVVPTRKPAAPAASGGFFGGILSGVQNAVSNAVKQQVGTYINQRLGIGPAAGGAGGAGGLGGLFDARNLIDNKRFGGLFAENKPAGSSGGTTGGTSVGPGGYPVTVDQRSSATNYNQQYASPPAQPVPYPQNYGGTNTGGSDAISVSSANHTRGHFRAKQLRIALDALDQTDDWHTRFAQRLRHHIRLVKAKSDHRAPTSNDLMFCGTSIPETDRLDVISVADITG